MAEDNKYRYFVCTIKTSKADSIILEKKCVKDVFCSIMKEYTFQMEYSTTGLPHYQCCFETKIRKSVKTVINDLHIELAWPRELIEVDRSMNYESAKAYCSDKGKRAEGTDYCTNVSGMMYKGKDIEFLDEKEKRYPWQKSFMERFFIEDESRPKDPDDRSIFWIKDSNGNTGKSKFTKWLCHNNTSIIKIPFGSSTQLRSSVIEEGPKLMYIIDLPRTLGSEDSLNNVYSVIEDMKNGYVRSGMYGKSTELFMDPPHIIVFSNFDCPTDKLSHDRWKLCSISSSKALICATKFTSVTT